MGDEEVKWVWAFLYFLHDISLTPSPQRIEVEPTPLSAQ